MYLPPMHNKSLPPCVVVKYYEKYVNEVKNEMFY